LIETYKEQIEEKISFTTNFTELFTELTEYFKDFETSDDKVRKLKNAIEKVIKTKGIDYEKAKNKSKIF